MKLYNYFRSSASFRVRIALELKGLAYDYLPVHLVKGEHKADAYATISPSLLVPTLETDGGERLGQSMAIAKALAQRDQQTVDRLDRARQWLFPGGVPQELRTAAQQGAANSQLALGHAYREGRGVPKDSTEAVRWYRKAAGQGQADAQYQMGVAHLQGMGALKDAQSAELWFTKAAEQGHREARFAMGEICAKRAARKVYPIPQAAAEAVAWYRKAAAQGHQAAIRALEAKKE